MKHPDCAPADTESKVEKEEIEREEEQEEESPKKAVKGAVLRAEVRRVRSCGLLRHWAARRCADTRLAWLRVVQDLDGDSEDEEDDFEGDDDEDDDDDGA